MKKVLAKSNFSKIVPSSVTVVVVLLSFSALMVTQAIAYGLPNAQISNPIEDFDLTCAHS